MFLFTAIQRRVCLGLFVAIFLYDLFAQIYYLAGPLYTAPATTHWMPLAGLPLGAIALFARGRASRGALAALAFLHYACTALNGGLYTEGDTWLWLLAIAFVAIPSGAGAVESYWAGVYRLVGFCVYFFAGLHKAVRPEWWSGQAIGNVFLDDALINPKYLFLVSSPLLCRLLCLTTLAQRLVVPWGFWSSRPAIRRASALILALMHYSYMAIMNLGTFSWVGILYLTPLLLDRAGPSGYFALPRGDRPASRALAAVFSLMLLVIPAYHFAVAAGGKTLPALDGLTARGASGILLDWGMFANTQGNLLHPLYTVETCAGKTLTDDDVLWNFGESKDYFRRRALRGVFNVELLDESRLGPLEKRIIKSFPELIHSRRVLIFRISRDGQEKIFDSGARIVSHCPARDGV